MVMELVCEDGVHGSGGLNLHGGLRSDTAAGERDTMNMRLVVSPFGDSCC